MQAHAGAGAAHAQGCDAGGAVDGGACHARPVARAGVAALPARQHGRAAQRSLQLLQGPPCAAELPL
jgi:hypothetical protein